jgi:hypothetical protein
MSEEMNQYRVVLKPGNGVVGDHFEFVVSAPSLVRAAELAKRNLAKIISRANASTYVAYKAEEI